VNRFRDYRVPPEPVQFDVELAGVGDYLDFENRRVA
jgi:hypothetical protein